MSTKPILFNTDMVRAILAAIETYRKEHGPGSIPELARLAKVGESELRDMISCAQVSITVWRKVSHALGVDRPTEGKEPIA